MNPVVAEALLMCDRWELRALANRLRSMLERGVPREYSEANLQARYWEGVIRAVIWELELMTRNEVTADVVSSAVHGLS